MNLRFVWFIEFTVNQCVALYVTVELTIFYIHTSYSEKKPVHSMRYATFTPHSSGCSVPHSQFQRCFCQ